jgi:hypothetical protein
MRSAGASGNDAGGTDAGKTYLMLGSAITAAAAGTTFDLSNASYSFVGEAAGDESGISVASAGDVDNDGQADLLIGANRWDVNQGTFSSEGKTYPMLGSDITAAAAGTAFDLSNASYSFVGEELSDQSGRSVASAGDVNNDGKTDLLIGAPFNDEGEDGLATTVEEGKTYLIMSPF